MLSSVGVPTRSKIIWIWLRSLFPAKIGFLKNISPKTQLVTLRSAGGSNQPSTL